MTDRQKHAVIAGAGLAGALMTVLLARRGWRVDLYERRPDPRAAGYVGGRSINLALSVRGLTALARAGLEARVLEKAIPMRGRMMHDRAGTLTFQAYSRDPSHAINSVSRGGLNIALLDAAEAHDGVTIHFEHRCTGADLDSGTARFETPTGEVTAGGDLLVAADGAFSAVRGELQRTDRFDYSQSYLTHGYKELTIPPTADGGFALDRHALHIWPHGGSMMIALPNTDGSFTCTLFWPFEGPHSFAALPPETASDEAILGFFRSWYGDAVPVMPTLLEDYRANPVSSLVTVRCRPWHRGDRVVLVGDAAHAIVPFYGQGMNAAFEDCRVLDELLEAHGDDTGPALSAYTAARTAQGDAIADLALANFVEMRDKVASPMFLARKRLEKLLEGVLPSVFTPLYELVSFTNVPYAEAQARGRAQDRAIRRLVGGTIGGAAAIVLVVAWLLSR